MTMAQQTTLSAAPMTSTQPFEERRQAKPFAIFYGGVRGGRPFGRRMTDREGNYLAWYESRLLYVTVATLLLCFADAVLTLNILGSGGTELNWFMAVLIETDVALFGWVKMLLCGAGLVFLVAHANFRLFRLLRVEHLVYLLLPMYAALVVYELVLLSI